MIATNGGKVAGCVYRVPVSYGASLFAREILPPEPLPEDAPTVVMAHGWCLDQTSWHRVIDELFYPGAQELLVAGLEQARVDILDEVGKDLLLELEAKLLGWVADLHLGRLGVRGRGLRRMGVLQRVRLAGARSALHLHLGWVYGWHCVFPADESLIFCGHQLKETSLRSASPHHG